MSKFTSRIKEELEALLPPTLFFFVMLHIVAIIRSLMLKGTGITLTSSLSVTLAAVVLGKAVLLADMLPIVNRYPDKPLIYNVVWKTVIYVTVSLLIHYAEHLFDYWRETGSFAAGNRELLAKIIWPHFFAIQLLISVMIFSYCVLRELVRVIGKQEVVHMFFGKPLIHDGIQK
jgi:hypothetical protein